MSPRKTFICTINTFCRIKVCKPKNLLILKKASLIISGLHVWVYVSVKKTRELLTFINHWSIHRKKVSQNEFVWFREQKKTDCPSVKLLSKENETLCWILRFYTYILWQLNTVTVGERTIISAEKSLSLFMRRSSWREWTTQLISCVGIVLVHTFNVSD